MGKSFIYVLSIYLYYLETIEKIAEKIFCNILAQQSLYLVNTWSTGQPPPHPPTSNWKISFLKQTLEINIAYQCRLLISFANNRPDKMSGLIWIQTVWHTDGITERIFLKKLILKKIQQKMKKACKITQ